MKRSNVRKIYRKLYKLEKNFQSLANPEHIKVVEVDKVAYLQRMIRTFSVDFSQAVDELEIELEPEDDKD